MMFQCSAIAYDDPRLYVEHMLHDSVSDLPTCEPIVNYLGSLKERHHY